MGFGNMWQCHDLGANFPKDNLYIDYNIYICVYIYIYLLYPSPYLYLYVFTKFSLQICEKSPYLEILLACCFWLLEKGEIVPHWSSLK